MKRDLATADTVTYKGRRYTALYIGQTKYGPRAHLEYLDGTKDFWVDADLVTDPRDDMDDTDHGPAARAADSEDAAAYRQRYELDEANAAAEISAYEGQDDFDDYEPPAEPKRQPAPAPVAAPKRTPAPRKRRAAPAFAGGYDPYAVGA